MTKQELKQILRMERDVYPGFDKLSRRMYARLCHERDYDTWRYMRYLRKTEYHFERKSHLISKLLYIHWKRKKNRLGAQIGLDCGENAIGAGVYIAHRDIIIGSCQIGKNCKLHGQNCVGSGAVIGDNCELWVGAKVFGPARLADNITVAAGAVVISSFDEPGVTIGGVPARVIKRQEPKE